MYGLGTTLKFNNDVKVPESKSLAAHSLDMNGQSDSNFFKSSIFGVVGQNNKTYHQAPYLETFDANENVTPMYEAGRILTQNTIELGSLFDKLNFDLVLENNMSGDRFSSETKDQSTTISFYSLKEPGDLYYVYSDASSKYDGEESDYSGEEEQNYNEAMKI
ncbi:hypothetical protein KEH51_05080 [[Brevibacterium] frigoritolerans]|uniref:Uncharacterized protein n=1 Tax=Peribacillus frigoritolerans TaxID=450367 RepID=A0A941FMH5_9BACI|nr:hypothetical protein [Peribacillus frigoritolerans]